MPDHIPLLDRPVEDLITVLGFYLCVEDTLGFDPHKRSHLTESVAPAFLYSDLTVAMGNLRTEMHFHIRMLLHQLAHPLIDLTRSARQASCAGADQDPASAVLDLCF